MTNETGASPARRAVAVGSAMIDVIAIVAPENIERMAMRNEGATYLLLEQGRKVPAESVTTHIGGGGCNVATSLARRGWRAAALAKTGRDLNAAAVREHLDRNGVETRLVASSEADSTGVSIMVASHDRNAAIFVQRGANETLSPDDVPSDAFEGVDLAYIAPLSSGSADCFAMLAARAKAAGALVAANPGVRQLTSRAEAFFGALDAIDLLSLNAAEAAALAPGLVARGAGGSRPSLDDRTPALWRRGLSFGGFDLSLPDYFEAIHRLGPRRALITDGGAGAYLSEADGETLFCPPAPVKVAGSAGAGDAFCSTLASELARGEDAERALRAAAVNAASVVGAVNTTDGLLSHDALDAAIAASAPGVMRLR